MNYRVAMPERRKKEGVFHANMLKRSREPVCLGYFVTEVADEEDELEALTWDGGKTESRYLGSSCWRNRGEPSQNYYNNIRIPSPKSQD